jgi:hypothetical protein
MPLLSPPLGLEPEVLESLRRTTVQRGSAVVVAAALGEIALSDPGGGLV